jgi:predicted O-methyltransferase YrrM
MVLDVAIPVLANQPRRAPLMPVIGLSMIVKNEAPVIERCLASVRPFINRWAIVDTGSTDGTQQRIRDLLCDLPGRLLERPWRDFASNRNEALELARAGTDYVLIIDADDDLEYGPNFLLPPLTDDVYNLRIRDVGSIYDRPQLVRSTIPCRWRGVLHEFLDCPGARHGGTIEGLFIRRNYDGARRRSPDTHYRDAAVLAQVLASEPDPSMRSRYTFYLAQTYRECGEKERAIETYLARAELGFWEQEVYVSLTTAGRLMAELGHQPDEILPLLERASAVCPSRTEALYTAAQLCRQHGREQQTYAFAKRGIDVPLPGSGLFFEDWIYDYGLLDVFAAAAAATGRNVECVEACLRLLGGKLPEAEWPRVQETARRALEGLAPSRRSTGSVADPASPLLPAPPDPDGAVPAYDFSVDWFSVHSPGWQQIVQQCAVTPSKVLEIGSFEGRATTWIVENFVGPNQGQLFCVDTWEGGFEHDKSQMGAVEARFDRNVGIALRKCPAAEVIKVKGPSWEKLAKLLAAGHAGSFDFIYVDGSHLSSDVMSDLVLAFALCRVGGLIACDDYLWCFGEDPRRTPKMAIDAFVNCYAGRLRVVPAWLHQVYMVKVAA